MNEKEYMDKLRKDAAAASAITQGTMAAKQGGDTVRRYQFVDRKEAKPGYVIIYDMVMQQPVAELVERHAQMVYLMYVNMHGQNQRAADEFMYGHNLGVTMALLYAEHYPKCTMTQTEYGTVVKMTDPSSGHSTELRGEQNKMADEMIDRIRPKENDGNT